MNSKILCICLCILSMAFLRPALAGQAYFSLLSDIPLMPSMMEVEGQSFSFEKPEGRVVESVGFLSASTTQAILEYYRDALMPLGWKPLENNVFSRNHEQIRIDVERVQKGFLIKFRLSPQQALLSR